jgi:hypothetical protein
MRTTMLRYAIGVGSGMFALAAGTGFAQSEQEPPHPARWRSTAFPHRTVRCTPVLLRARGRLVRPAGNARV